jgi:hypothetical protein
LRDRGFFPLLDRNRCLIEGFASIGLATSMMPQEPLVEAWLKARGLDLHETLAAVDRIVERYGLARVVREGGCLLPMV